jgi:hypothetical protein
VAFGSSRFAVTVAQAAAEVKLDTPARAASDRRWPVHLGMRPHGADGERCEDTRRFTRAGSFRGPPDHAPPPPSSPGHRVDHGRRPCESSREHVSAGSHPEVLACIAGAESVAKIIRRTDCHTRHRRVGMLGRHIRPHARKFSSGAAQTMDDGACLVGEGGRTCGRHLHQGRLGSHWLPGANRAVAGRL